MSKGKSPLVKRLTAFFLTALLVAAADQFSKLWIRSYSEGQVIFQAGFLRIIHIGNTGAAFGLFQDQSFFLTIVAFIGITIILLIALFFSHRLSALDTIPGSLVLGLILGGTVGNLVDRLRYGHVTDFISVSIWPTFNIADSALTIGVILFAYLFLISARDNKPVQPEQKGA
jgi:signal peptidase II